MIRLFIDNILSDVDQSTPIYISLSVATLTKIESARTGYSKTFKVPMTAHNMKIMGDTDQINCVQMFNQSTHTVRVECDGCTVIEGTLCLSSIEGDTKSGASGGNRGWYVCNIIGSGKTWVKHACESTFKDIAVDYYRIISEYTISQSWSGAQSVRFLPVQRDLFAIDNVNSNLFAPAKVLSFEDYHPFLNVKSMLDAIMRKAGYRIQSQFMESEYFGSLHISGKYPTKNVDLLRERMDFCAGRFLGVSATADSNGRVHANPYSTLNSVGNIVDTADPKQTQNSVAVEGVFSANGCFQRLGERVAFVPVQEVSMGFEYSVKYSTDYFMLNRRELKCFNIINLGDDQRAFKIANRNADRRNQLVTGKQFMLIVFDYKPGTIFQIRYKVISNPNADPDNLRPEDLTTIIYGIFFSRTTLVTLRESRRVVSMDLYVFSTTDNYTPYLGDWALYDGYVKERGTVDVEAVLRSGSEKITDADPKFFDRIYFGGAEPGMNFTLSNTTTVRPIFLPHPSQGSSIKFEDVAAHEMHQIELVNSIKQMFNLYFYTDNFDKVVYIEPRSEFYRNDVVVDWSDKMDYGQSVEVSELGGDMSQLLELKYCDGDGAVARWNQAQQQSLGQWSAAIHNNFAKQGKMTYANPIFTPSINAVGDYPDAPACSLIQVGDGSRGQTVRSEDLNFAPKIAHYLGLLSLPEGQRWGWPEYGQRYPFVVFHHKGLRNPPYQGTPPNPDSVASTSLPLDVAKILDNGISLCFEDRDTVAGLHRYYDNNIELYNNSKRVGVYLYLGPQDVEPLIFPNAEMRDFRALYRLKVNGEYAMFRLEQVCDYNPASGGSTKCIFIKNL